jgi:hypothetical protein
MMIDWVSRWWSGGWIGSGPLQAVLQLLVNAKLLPALQLFLSGLPVVKNGAI